MTIGALRRYAEWGIGMGIYALPLLAALIWSGNTVVTRLSAGVIAPEAIAFYRWLLAGLLLTPFLLHPVWRDRYRIAPLLPKLAVLGLLGMVLYQGLAYVAAKTTPATNMAIIASLIPLITLVLSIPLLHEPPTLGTLLGGVVSLAGLCILMGHGEPLSLLDHGIGQGDFIMLLAALSYAGYGVLLRRWAVPLPIWQSLYMQIWFGVLFLLPFFLHGPAAPITARNLPLILYATIPTSIGAPYIWMLALKHLGPSRASIFLNLVPVFTALLAILLAGEHLEHYHLIGGAMALAGVALAQRLRRPLSGASAAS
jgi:drug/metabolite transporter (DMT)-like permease